MGAGIMQENNTNRTRLQSRTYKKEKEMIDWSLSPRTPSPSFHPCPPSPTPPPPPTLPFTNTGMKSLLRLHRPYGPRLDLLHPPAHHASPARLSGGHAQGATGCQGWPRRQAPGPPDQHGYDHYQRGRPLPHTPDGMEFVAASTFPKQREEGNQPVVLGQVLSWAGITLAPRKKLT